ncbi:MAG: hypothetical protein ACYTEZ_03880 [Planctomycetota bacterium]
MLGPVLLTLAGLAGLFVPLGLNLGDLPDAVPLALLAGGAGWGWRGWWKRRGKARLGTAAGQTAVVGVLAYWMLVYSAYAEAGGVPEVGERAPLITAVRVRDGATFRLAAQRGSTVLLVFFRGAW